MPKSTQQQVIMNGVAVTIIGSLILYLGVTIVRMERFMIGERCTQEHCETIRIDQARLDRRIDNLEEQVHELPPDIFEALVYDLRDRVSRLENRVLGNP